MSQMNDCARQLATLALAASLLAPRPAAAETVDDAFLISTSVRPNVLLILDNSDAMNQIEWHEAFDPQNSTGWCTFYDNTKNYIATELPNSDTQCSNTRTIYKSDNNTRWDGRYLNWYFSDLADPYINEIETAVVQSAGCNQAGAQTRFVQQYRRTRFEASKQVYYDVLCLSEPKGLRFGLAIFRDPAEAANPKVDPNGGFVASAVDDGTPAHAADLEAHIGNAKLTLATPLSETVFQLYTYFMSRNVANIPVGQNGITKFPAYAYDKFGAVPNQPSKILGDPVEFACQKNYMILVTSGLSTRDDFDQDPASTSQGYSDFDALIGDYYAENLPPTPNPDVETARPDEGNLYLDDIVKYMHENDMRPDFDDDQTIDFYTIGFGTTPDDNAYLYRTSEGVGGGLHFEVQSGAALSRALVDALNDIVEKSRSFTAATVPSARTADGGDFYNSFFVPSGKSASWEGHLRAWKFSAAGEILDSNGDCALADPDGGGECNNGPFKVICQTAGQSDCVVPYWDAGDELSEHFVPGDSNAATDARQLYTSKLSGSSPVRTDVDFNLTAADMKITTWPVLPADDAADYVVKGSKALNAEGLADEVIAFARGCHFGTGVDDASGGVSGGVACNERSWLLGDIFHSDPIVVRNPPDRNLGSAYDTFRAAYLDRDRVILTGTNGGYLEAFHAGDWNLSTEVYSPGTGLELFGFMPWEPRTKIKNQPIDNPSDRTHYVDGAPQVADAWLYDSATDPVQDADDWRTVLVGGLREGGRHYYALDVTNPSADGAAPAGDLPYPGLLWEFPNEDDANGNGADDYVDMGQTWGQAVITRVKLKVAGNNNGGQGFERWVAIVAGGYDATSDPNPAAVDPSSAYDPASTKGRAIYMLDLKSGQVIAEQKVANPGLPDSTPVQDQMQYSLVSTPAVLDLDADGFADVVYIGDLAGNLFKWVIKPIGEDRANDASSLRTQPNWKFQHFFQAPVDTVSGDNYYKNVFQPPAAAYVGTKLWIAFGTGERAAIGYKGLPTHSDAEGEENRFYGITDPDPLALSATAPAVLTEAGLTNITTVGTPVTSPRGYYFTVVDGEKFVTTTVIFAGKVITASFTPSQLQFGDPGFDPCTQRGNGNLYIFDLASGTGEFTDGGGDESRFTDIGSGLPTDPKISIGVGGDDNKIVIQKSGTDIQIFDADDVDFGRGIIYWREMH